MKRNPFLFLGIAISLGILSSNMVSVNLTFQFLFLVLNIIFYILLEKQVFGGIHKSVKNLLLFTICFSFGFVNFSLSKKENNLKSLNVNYLKHDVILGKILSLKKSSSEFIKTEFQVDCLIRDSDTIFVKDKILLFLKENQQTLKVFDECLLNVELNKIKTKNNPGEFDAEFYWKHKGIEYIGFANEENYFIVGEGKPNLMYVFESLRNYFSSVLSKFLKGDELGLAKALILGDRSSLDSEVTAKFGNTGAMHVLAVSGLHVGILLQILTLFLGLFVKWIPKNKAIIISLIIIWIYAFMTGFSASVVRAVIMFSVLVGSQLFEREYRKFNVLSFAAVIILLWNPHFLFDIGFQLSFLAMAGIFMFYTPLSKVIFIKNKILKGIYDGTMVGIAAQIMTIPLTLYYFHQFPNYFIITNICLMLFSFLILVFGMGLFTFHSLSFLAKPISWLLFGSLFGTLFIVDQIDKLPGAVSNGFDLPVVSVIVLFLLILFFYLALKTQKLKALKLCLVGTLIFCSILIVNRFSQMKQEHICFLQANELCFIVKLENQNLVFFANKDNDERKAEFIAKSYEKIYPGKLSYYEISSKKSTDLSLNENKISIVRKKGGYEISLNKQQFFYASNLNFESEIPTVIYAPWLTLNTEKFQLNNNSFLFSKI